MSTFNISRTRLALAAAALMACAAAAHAAPGDPAPMKDLQTPPMSDKPNGADNKVGQAVSDSWITTKVKSELLANSASKGMKVEVTTKDGVVSLKGKLPTLDAVAVVKAIAESVKGVQRVDVSALAIESAG